MAKTVANKMNLKLRDGVRRAYGAAAANPAADHPFPVGRRFAESLGYPAELLESLPSVSVEAFAGVSNLAVVADIPAGATVLDLGCGGGLDSIIAAQRVGPTGRVICIDFSQTMLKRARQGGLEARAENIDYHLSYAEGLPIPEQSVDIALANGIFNLNPSRGMIFAELARVLKPGGAVYAAELVLRQPLDVEVKADESNWFAWIAGAKEGGAFLNEFLQAGFQSASALRTCRNARTKNEAVLAMEVKAVRWHLGPPDSLPTWSTLRKSPLTP